MAINEWWAGDPAERYWLEITDRENLGVNLHAPKVDGGGNPYWSYELVAHVAEGDIVLHHWKRPGREPAIVGLSTAVGQVQESTIIWTAHGTYGRGRGSGRPEPSWLMPLTGFTELDTPLGLAQLRETEDRLRAVREELAADHGSPLYFPYAFSSRQPLRTTQGYLVKFPAALVDALTPLRDALTTGSAANPPSGKGRRGRGARYQQDVAVRRAIERHAVSMATDHFEKEGYVVDDGTFEPFDLVATRGEVVRVEVKGTSGPGLTVELRVRL